ncbi:MAG: glycosyltransferase family 4 protein [Bacillota bacterium]|nr:glycosyltransferase family 4 protein [Bacillota bacterium]
MKVALVYLGRRGGGSVYSLELARALSRRVELLAVVSRYAENLEHWRRLSIPLVEVATYRSMAEAALSTLDWGKFSRLRKALLAFNPAIVHHPMLHLWSPLVNALLPPTARVVTTLHDPRPHRGEAHPLLTLVRVLAVRQSQRVIVLSRSLVPLVPLDLRRRGAVDVIPHGEFSFYLSGAAQPCSSQSQTLLYFGRILPYKGLDVLAAAWPEIQRRVPGARLVVAGAGNFKPYRTAFSPLKGVEIQNRWFSDQEVAALFGRAAVVVLPYRDASQSGVIPLAAAFGRPVVATRVGGLEEQIEDGQSGLLVSPGDPLALAEACARLLLDRRLAARLGEGLRRRAEQEWSWERIAELTLVTYRKALEGD